MQRRAFLTGLTGALVQSAPAESAPCWLDVAAPFIVVDPKQQLSSQILLTATCFPGIDGYRDNHLATEYQIDLYDHTGKPIPLDNNGRLEVASLHPTLVNMADWAKRDSFFGSAKVRVAPSAHQMPHAGDLFSAGFVRWDLPGNFDNIHAQPAAPQQLYGRFNYSMPFPPLSEYHCALALFNLDDDESYGQIRVVDRLGPHCGRTPLPPAAASNHTLHDERSENRRNSRRSSRHLSAQRAQACRRRCRGRS
jgi:hypothetical protein